MTYDNRRQTGQPEHLQPLGMALLPFLLSDIDFLPKVETFIIASAISSNHNALFIPCDHMLYVHAASLTFLKFTMPQARQVNHVHFLPSALGLRAMLGVGPQAQRL